jgi:hypothetical protein
VAEGLFSDLRFRDAQRGAVALVDHAAEHLAALSSNSHLPLLTDVLVEGDQISHSAPSSVIALAPDVLYQVSVSVTGEAVAASGLGHAGGGRRCACHHPQPRDYLVTLTDQLLHHQASLSSVGGTAIRRTTTRPRMSEAELKAIVDNLAD